MKVNLFSSASFGVNHNRSKNSGRQPIPVYSIDSRTGECKRYDSLSALAKELSIVTQAVSSAYRDGYKIHGLIIKKTSETEDKNGNVDTEKVKDIIKNQPKRGKKGIPIYAISSEGNFEKFPSQQDFSIAVKCNHQNVIAGLNLGHKVRGYIVKRASEIEDENGKVNEQNIKDILEQDRIKTEKKALRIAKKLKKQTRKRTKEKAESPIYAINVRTGGVIKFADIKKAAEIFGTHVNSILYFLQNPRLAINNYRITRASRVEDENGNVDAVKMKEFLA